MSAEIAVEQTRHGYRIIDGALTIEAEYPSRDHGAIRATVTVAMDGAIVTTDLVNLTTEKRRQDFLARLAARGVTVSDAVLIALELQCRSTGGANKSDKVDNVRTMQSVSEMFDPPVEKTIDELTAIFGKWLLIADTALLPIVTGALLAHRFGGDPVWLLVVAPPGAIKSELLRTFYGYPGIYPLSELTPRTFASGLDVPGNDPSLLARLSEEILVLKDFTSTLEMRREDRQAILAQLREIYDGRYDKAWGTGKELHWEGRLALVAGVTSVIDRHQAALAVLGERFVHLRIVMPDRLKMAKMALDGAGQEPTMRAELADAMHGFLAARGTTPPAVSDETQATLAAVADFVTRARSGVIRDGYRRELEYAPEPEAPTRFAKVLLNLARGIALAYDSPAVTEQELGLVLRVAIDSLPVIRQRVIAALVTSAITDTSEGVLSTKDIAGATQFSTVSIRRTLEDLQALGLVTCHKGGQGNADRWELHEEWRAIFTTLRDAAAAINPLLAHSTERANKSDKVSVTRTISTASETLVQVAPDERNGER